MKLLVFASVMAFFLGAGATAQDEKPREPVRAPELEGGVEWLNTDKPIKLAELKGKIVLLDFWTFCCINCIHIIPDLKKLEAKYPKELVVIGVHSAKFTNEKDSDNIREAIKRYEIEHPVVNDADMKIWRRYSVHAWPTLWLIDPDGNLVGYLSGEGHYRTLDNVIGKLVAASREKKQLNETPLPLALERFKPRTVASPLNYPGKILADEKSQRLFISDSNHNRIVITDFSGKVLAVAGSGAIGQRDGKFDDAEFDHPQGMALGGDTLYVADTENHMIRALDLKAKTVSTVAGDGEQARGLRLDADPLKVSISSPWDLALVGDKLYIAMAGVHAIWAMDLQTKKIGPFTGGWREDRIDGSKEQAAFAQPSGLATDGKKLWVADSEVSSIREVDIKTGDVRTIVGEALFEFGDIDGGADIARLQHALGVAHHDGLLYVADTYNDKIKIVDPLKRTSTTWLGIGKHGRADGKLAAASFYEPCGLSIASGKVFIADTNNHLIRVADLKSGEVTTLAINGLEPPDLSELITLPVQTLRANTQAALEIDVKFPKGFKLNPGSPISYRISVINGDVIKLDLAQASASGEGVRLPVTVPFKTTAAGKGDLRAELTFYYCNDGPNAVCKTKTVTWKIPVEVVKDKGATTVAVQFLMKGM